MHKKVFSAYIPNQTLLLVLCQYWFLGCMMQSLYCTRITVDSIQYGIKGLKFTFTKLSELLDVHQRLEILIVVTVYAIKQE